MDDKKAKEILNEIDKIKSYKKKTGKKKNILGIITVIMFIITLLLGIGYLGYNILYSSDKTNQLYLVINSAIIVVVMILFMITIVMTTDKSKKIMSIITSLFFIGFVSFNFLVTTNSINLPTQAVLQNFANENISEVIKWANANKVTIEQSYEYSDNVAEYHIISQSVVPNTLLKDVKKINVVVSSGPNYDKQVIISNMVGWNIDDALKSINENFLNNVTINYAFNNEVEKDMIIEQNVKGQMRRNDPLTLKVSLGNKDNLMPVAMIDLKNMKLFDATLWLKRNGINYKLEYQFSDKVNRNYIISQSEQKETMINQSESTVTLIVSKGKEIIVPDLKQMTVDEITKWVIENNLKIKYEDQYDADIEFGKVINVNYKSGDKIEEGTTINLVTSKGQLRMPKFSSINEFRDWASKYDIKTEEQYEYNDKVKKGSIIKFSHEENDIISPTDKIIVYLSDGAPITIPNFVGKTKSSILNSCYSLGLNCTFTYSGYSSTAKDTAVSQNKKAGSTVVSGTYVNIGLSLGTAKNYTVEISEAQLTLGDADKTISTLKTWFASKYPGVTFTFYKKASNTYANAGFIHENSPIKDGSSITQGKTYQIWITN
jgi:beta-lactam-binding protein with PASTA domain